MTQLLAFDRGSVRSFDKDGRMRVETSRITREQVTDYLGREIPKWDELGLDPTKVYALYRSAEEIEKAAATFNTIPILVQHVHVTAIDSRKELVVGATGSDAKFSLPYLFNSMVIWDAEGIELIESEEAKELSCSYHFTAVIDPGNFKGQPFDIRMVDLIANHVALVPCGRAGPNVVVGDQLPKELSMTKKVLPSRMASIARGALLALKPMLAADSALDLSSLTHGITAKDWLVQKPVLVKVITPKLANDADVGTLHKLLDGLDGEAKAPENADAPAAPKLGTDDAGGTDPGAGAVDPDASLDAVDADPCADLMQMLAGKLSPEEMSAFEEKLRSAITPAAALDEGLEATTGTPPKPATAAAPAAAKPKEPDMITKTAMDAALAKATADAVTKGRALAREISEAEKICAEYVGDLPVMDSAPEYFKATLGLLGVKTDGIHVSALRAVLEAQPKNAGEVETPRLAMDAQVELGKRFPDLDRIRVL